MERSDIDRRLAEKGERDARLLEVLGGKSRADRQRDLPAHDGVAPQEAAPLVEKVHRAAFALRDAALLAAQLRHHLARVHSFHQRVPVLAIGGQDIVVRLESRKRPHRHRFLADVQVAEAPDLSQGVEFRRLFFEAANQEHLLERVS